MDRVNWIKMKKINKIFVFLLLIVIASDVYGFAVSSPYWKERPMGLHPGGSEIVTLTMQNTLPDDDDTYVNVELESGGIAKIVGGVTRYFVPYGSQDVTVDVEVNIPKDAIIGETYTVSLKFKPDLKPTTGMLAIGLEIIKGFDVKVVEPPIEPEEERAEFPINTLAILLFVVVIAIFILVALSKKKSGKKKKKR